ncbi:uncharacterized protein LOC144663863 [Oculina patagonica]
MVSAYSQVCFTVLLAVFGHAQALARSHHSNTIESHGFGNETQCSWNCTVHESDLTEEIKVTIANGKLIQLVVKYENKVDDKCVNQTSRNSSGNVTEQWQIWLANTQRSTFERVMEKWKNMMLSANSNEEHKEIRAKCTFKPLTTTATKPKNSASSPTFYQGHLADLGIKFDSTECSTEEKDDLKPCLNISKSPGNSITPTKSPEFKRGGWPAVAFVCLCLVFLAVFIYYSPAFLCFFSPTEVTEDGVRQIVLEGASPVSFRSLMGNYFFSIDETIWHRARMFFLRVVVLPLLFLGPAIFADYLQRNKMFPTFHIFGLSHLFQLRMLVCSGCYFVLNFYISFFTTRSSKANRPCFFCKRVKSKTLMCGEVPPKKVLNHLRLQPLILVKCWRAFIRCLLKLFKLFVLVLPASCKVSTTCFLRVSAFVIFLLVIPAATVTLLTAMLLAVGFSIIFTSPLMILCFKLSPVNAYFSNPSLKLFLLFLVIAVAIPTLLGALFVLELAGIGVLMAIVLAFVLLLSEEILPFVVCFVLVLYYMWSSYSSFTNKYQDLALSLFKHFKKSRSEVCVTVAVNNNQVPENASNADDDSKDNVMKIPKELFHMACEELMPIREGVCILLLKVTLIVSFVFLVFSITMMLNVGATPIMKALLTFLTGSFPKIVAIYIDGGRQKRIEAMATDEKIPKIVQKYISGTTETSLSNQEQDHRSADDDEVLLLDVDKENIEQVNM